MSDCTTSWDVLQKAIGQLSTAERLHLMEEVARSLQPSSVVADPKRQRAHLDRLCRELTAMPVHNPADGFSGRDHDRLLYGELK